MASSKERFEEAVEALKATMAGGPPAHPPQRPGEDGDDPGMEARVKRLEEDVKEIKSDLKILSGDVRELKGQVGALERAVISKIPTGWSFFAIIISAIGLTLATVVALPNLSRIVAP